MIGDTQNDNCDGIVVTNINDCIVSIGGNVIDNNISVTDSNVSITDCIVSVGGSIERIGGSIILPDTGIVLSDEIDFDTDMNDDELDKKLKSNWIIGGNSNSCNCNITGNAINITNVAGIVSNITGNSDNELLTNTSESECTNNGSVCSSKTVINLMNEFVNIKKRDSKGQTASNESNMVTSTKGQPEEVIGKATQVLQCDSESCVLVNPEFNKFVEKKLGNNNIIKYELNKNFKTKGPRNSTNLLSNFNIDETLIRWAREFKDFYPCPFSMIDFKIFNNSFSSVNMADIISGNASYNDPIDGQQRRPFNTFGCVLNTDVSSGQGKHWVCIFVDCRAKRGLWTVEYFNSSGNPPNHDVNEWMETQRSHLLKIHNNVESIAVTNIVHQQSNTECGMYVLYYIRSRLDGISYKHFLTKRIKDEDVTKFRKHTFRKY